MTAANTLPLTEAVDSSLLTIEFLSPDLLELMERWRGALNRYRLGGHPGNLEHIEKRLWAALGECASGSVEKAILEATLRDRLSITGRWGRSGSGPRAQALADCSERSDAALLRGVNDRTAVCGMTNAEVYEVFVGAAHERAVGVRCFAIELVAARCGVLRELHGGLESLKLVRSFCYQAMLARIWCTCEEVAG